MTCQEALAHRWLAETHRRLSVIEKADLVQVFQRLKDFKKMERLQMTIWLTSLPNLDQSSYSKSSFAFTSIDTDYSGQIDMEEMRLAIQDLKFSVSDLEFGEDDVEEAFDKIDLDRTGLITHSQFIVATFDRDILDDEEVVRSMFRDLDSLQQGFVTKESMKIAFQRKGTDLPINIIENFLSGL